MNKEKKRMSEDEKKKKFGDKYDPNFNGKKQSSTNGSSDCKKVEKKKNDWRWYAINEQIAKDVGNLPFNLLSGVGATAGYDLAVAESAQKHIRLGYTLETVLKISYVNAQPTKLDKGNNGITLAANQLYTFIRHANSGARNYEPADVMMYVLAMRDIYSNMAEAARALGIINYFSFENRAIPKRIIQALNIDYDDLIGNVAEYRGTYNLLVKRCNSLAMPKYFKAFERAAFIGSNVFMDSDSRRGQLYVFAKDGSYTFDSTTSSTGTSLTFTTHTYTNLGGLLSLIKRQLEAVETDTDALTMSGDILKAFNEADLYQFATLDENYIVVPVYSEDVCAQIENAFAYTAANPGGSYANSRSVCSDFGTTLNVTQGNGQLIWEPKASGLVIQNGSTSQGIPEALLFNSHRDNVDYRDVLDWSRLITSMSTENGATTDLFDVSIDSCGLELVLSFWVYPASIGMGMTSTAGVHFNQMALATAGKGDATIPYSAFKTLATIEQYDWHPALYLTDQEGDTLASIDIKFTVAMDLKKYTLIEKGVVNRIHSSANEASFYAVGLYDKQK